MLDEPRHIARRIAEEKTNLVRERLLPLDAPRELLEQRAKRRRAIVAAALEQCARLRLLEKPRERARPIEKQEHIYLALREPTNRNALAAKAGRVRREQRVEVLEPILPEREQHRRLHANKQRRPMKPEQMLERLFPHAIHSLRLYYNANDSHLQHGAAKFFCKAPPFVRL